MHCATLRWLIATVLHFWLSQTVFDSGVVLAMTTSEAPIARFGIITDVQYADKPDIIADHFGEKRWRFYQKVLEKTQIAVDRFNAKELDYVFHLGDIIDGNETDEAKKKDMASVLAVLSKLEAPLVYAVGNHCLEAGRDFATKSLDLPAPSYHEIDIGDLWSILVLDTMACSVMGASSEDALGEAQEYIAAHEGDSNASPFNGGLGFQQKTWLVERLKASRAVGKKVILCGHHPIAPDSAPATLLLWETDFMLKLLKENNDVVKAYFCGHYHLGGYVEKDGVHHVVFPSILDSVEDQGSHGIVTLRNTSMDIQGFGDVPTRRLDF